MEAIINSAIGLLSVSFLLSVFHFLFNEKYKYRVQYVSGLILTVYILQFVSPIISLVMRAELLIPESITQPETDDDAAREAIIRAASVQICNDIKKLIVSRYELNETDFIVSVTVECETDDQVMLKAITVRYHGETDELKSAPELIAKYIADTVGAPCTFIMESS